MLQVRLMKIALLVSNAWYSVITGSSCSQKCLAVLQPAGRQIRRGAARCEVAVGQPSPTGLLEQVEDFFPLAKRIQERAESPQIQSVGAHAHQVTGDPPQFGK